MKKETRPVRIRNVMGDVIADLKKQNEKNRMAQKDKSVSSDDTIYTVHLEAFKRTPTKDKSGT